MPHVYTIRQLESGGRLPNGPTMVPLVPLLYSNPPIRPIFPLITSDTSIFVDQVGYLRLRHPRVVRRLLCTCSLPDILLITANCILWSPRWGAILALRQQPKLCLMNWAFINRCFWYLLWRFLVLHVLYFPPNGIYLTIQTPAIDAVAIQYCC